MCENDCTEGCSAIPVGVTLSSVMGLTAFKPPLSNPAGRGLRCTLIQQRSRRTLNILPLSSNFQWLLRARDCLQHWRHCNEQTRPLLLAPGSSSQRNFHFDGKADNTEIMQFCDVPEHSGRGDREYWGHIASLKDDLEDRPEGGMQ